MAAPIFIKLEILQSADLKPFLQQTMRTVYEYAKSTCDLEKYFFLKDSSVKRMRSSISTSDFQHKDELKNTSRVVI